MSNVQESETSQQPKFSPYPLFLYAIVSSLVSWMLLPQFLGRIFYPEYAGMVDPFPGYFCAQITLFGIIAGMVGRHWLHGMALSLGLQTAICALAYAMDTVNRNDEELIAITGRRYSSLIILQYSVLTVVLPAIPSLLMRKLKSWRLVLNPTPHKTSSIEELLVATAFVAMITASVIQSYVPWIDYTNAIGAIGAVTVVLTLPAVRTSLSETSNRGSNESGVSFNPWPKPEVFAYVVHLGLIGTVVLTLFDSFIGLLFGINFFIFAVCLWLGIWCLGATGLRFRSQQMDDEARSLSRENSTESEVRANGSPDIVQSPFSNDSSNEPLSVRPSPEILGRWSLVMITALIAGFTLFKIWATQG